MNIKNLFILLIVTFITISCSSRDEEITPEYNPLTTKINLGVILYGTSGSTQLAYYFEYNDAEKLTKKIGGYVGVSPGTGYSGFFSNDMYTTLVYAGDKVTLEDFSTSNQFNVPKNNKYYKLNNANLILEKEIPEPLNFNMSRKQFYTYKNGLLDEIRTTYPNMPYDPTDPLDYIQSYSEKFYYDSSKNLLRTEYFKLRNGVKVDEKTVRTFGDYDSSYNPYKRLILLDEFFYRSLSKNNFRFYREEKTYYGNISFTEQNWTFNYDSNGNIIVN